MRVALIVLILLMSLNALSDLAVLIFAKIIDDDDDRRYWGCIKLLALRHPDCVVCRKAVKFLRKERRIELWL